MDELDLIAQYPGSGEPTDEAEDEVKARARVRVMRTISASEAHRRRRRAQGRRSPAGRTLKLGVAAAVGAVVLALVLPVAFRGRPASSASAALLKLAENASEISGWESPTHDQFIYVRSIGKSPVCDEGSCVLEPFDRESWISPDGSGRIVETRGSESSDERFASGELPFRDLYETLGWNLSRIRRHIEELAGIQDADDFTTFVLIGELMGETQLLPEKRNDLFRIAATLPETELLDPSTDALGRSGIGIGYSSGGLRYEVIFDQGSALVLEQRVVRLGGGDRALRNPAVRGGWLVAGSRTTYESSGLVESASERL